MQEILTRILPILIIIAIGFLAQKRRIFSPEMMAGLKKVVMNFGLPAVLFLTFMRIDLRVEYLGITLAVFLLCVLLFFLGRLFSRVPGLRNPLVPFFISSFAFGLVGIPLYLAVFGEGSLGNLSILGLGTELFIWVFFLPMMRIDLSGEKFSPLFFVNIFRSHLILAVLAGLLVNVLGWEPLFSRVAVLRSALSVLNYFGPVATPLVLMIVGYDLRLERQYMGRAAALVLVRKGLALALGYILLFTVIGRLTPLTADFRSSYFTILILPPPFSLPLFVGTYGRQEDVPLAVNAVVLDTIVCFVLFILYMFSAAL